MKLYPVQDDTATTVSNGSSTSVLPGDHEQLSREDLKYSVKIFLRSLEPELLSHTIDTGS